MNKIIGLGIGIAVIIGVIAVGSTIFNDGEINSFTGLPNEDNNEMMMGDKVSVTVTSSDEIDEQEEAEGKNVQVNIVDGVSATSTP